MINWILAEQKLRSWMDDPSQLEEPGLDVPTDVCLKRALQFVEMKLKKSSPATPTVRVAPTGDGAIAIDIIVGDTMLMTEFDEVGGAEDMIFKNNKVVYREKLLEE